MSNLNITFIVGAPGSGTSLVAWLFKKAGAFGGQVKPLGAGAGYAENTQIQNSCVIPYVRKFLPHGKDKAGKTNPLPSRGPLPFKNEWDFYQPPRLRELFLGILEREGWDGKSPIYFKHPETVLMAPVFHKAFPEAKWVVVGRNPDNIVTSLQSRRILPPSRPLDLRPIELFQRAKKAVLDCPDVDSVSVLYEDLIDHNFIGIKEAIERSGLQWDQGFAESFIIHPTQKPTLPNLPIKTFRSVEPRISERLRVICVLKTGGRYDADDVYNLRRLVKKNLTVDHDFICYSDDPAVADVMLELNLPGWWSKQEMFKEVGPCIYLDLDTYIGRNIDSFARQVLEMDGVAMFHKVRPDFPNWYGSDCMAWNCDLTRQLAELDTSLMASINRADRYISQKLQEQGIKPLIIKEMLSGVYSWKVSIEPNGRKLPEGTSLISFNREPKPRDLGAPYWSTRKPVLLIGSGKCAEQISTWTGEQLSKYCVVAINNAWSIPKEINYHVYAPDWHPQPGRHPTLTESQRITRKVYDTPAQHQRYGRTEAGISQTMFFDAAYWVLGTLNPPRIEFAGCSMDYPEGKANTFYGAGNADPLRFEKEEVRGWFSKFQKHAESQGCELINIGSRNGLMPW